MNSRESDTLELKAWRSLADTYRLVYARVNTDLRRFGLTPPQYSLLRTVGRSETGSLAMNQISKELLVTFADVTLIVDNLEKHHCLRRIRGTKDRRVVSVELTRKGRVLWERISAVHRKRIAELLSGLSSSELEDLLANTTKIRDRILINSGNRSGKKNTPYHVKAAPSSINAKTLGVTLSS